MVFEITVFSNPVTALVGEGGLLTDLPQAARYDEEFVKPALLLADKVTLRSHRIDLIKNDILDHNMLRWPVPLLSQSMEISSRRDLDELTWLGLASSDLLSDAEIERMNRSLGSGESDDGESEWAIERAEPFRVALAAFFRAHGDALSSQPLHNLGELLEELPWDPTPKTQPQKIFDHLAGDNTEFERAFLAMVDDVANSPMSVMMDDTVHGDVRRLSGSPVDPGSATVVRGAAELMRMVNGISAMSLDEIPDVRRDLGPYLKPFRSFMLEVSTGAERAGDDVERSRQLILAWEREVQPAVEELEALVRSASFRQNAIDVFASDGETLRTVGAAIGIAAASGFFGISALSASAAFAPPVLKAFIGSVRAKQSAKRGRAYFVHAMNRRASQRRA